MGRGDRMSDHDKAMRQYEHNKWLRDYESRERLQLFTAHVTAVSSLSSIALNSSILANSASAGAVLVFLSSLWGKPTAAIVVDAALWSVSVFAVGIFAGMLSAGFGYLSQLFWGYVDVRSLQGNKRKTLSIFAFSLQIIAIALGVSAISAFGYGACVGINTLHAAKAALLGS